MTSKNASPILLTEYEKISHATWEHYKDLAEKEGFDYILFDLPPTISDEVRQIIRNFDVVYVPTLLGKFEIASLKRVTDEIHKHGVKLGGVFVTPSFHIQIQSVKVRNPYFRLKRIFVKKCSVE